MPFKCFLDCIETGEFMHVYNAVIVLKEILPMYPVATMNERAGITLNLAIERFLEKEERGDLKILGKAYVFWHYSLQNTRLNIAV